MYYTPYKKERGGGAMAGELNKFKEKLKEITEFLEGERKEVILSRVENQYGEKIVKEALKWEEGKVVLKKINCWGSQALGLGSCRCESHTPYVYMEFNTQKVINYLKEYIVKEAERLAKRIEDREKLKEVAEEIKRILERFS